MRGNGEGAGDARYGSCGASRPERCPRYSWPWYHVYRIHNNVNWRSAGTFGHWMYVGAGNFPVFAVSRGSPRGALQKKRRRRPNLVSRASARRPSGAVARAPRTSVGGNS